MDAFDDRRLLAYNTYEEYLDSFVQTDDIFYLRSRDFARIKAALGYRLVMFFVYLLNERCNCTICDTIYAPDSFHFYNECREHY